MTATVRHPERALAGRPESGRSPELIAKQRSRDGVSSAAAAGRPPTRLPSDRSTTPALYSTGSAPLPKPSDAANAVSCQLLTARTVADMLDVCAETVLRWIRNGEMPAIRLPGEPSGSSSPSFSTGSDQGRRRHEEC